MGKQLTKYEYLVKFEKDGMLEDLNRHGIINKKIHTYYRYYREIQFLLLNYTLNDAVIKASEKLTVSERTMWRALKAMRS